MGDGPRFSSPGPVLHNRPMRSRLRIVVAGLVGQHPVGGVAFDYLQYVLGLADLGHDVAYHEDTWSWPYDPVRRTVTDDPSYSTAMLHRFFERHAPELADRWHYVHLHETHHGMSAADFAAFAAGADLFLNVSGASMVPNELSNRCTTVFVDTDPGYNQIVMLERPAWSENVDRWVESVRAHDRHVTYAEAMGTDACRVPDVGLRWHPTRMPIVPRLWADLPSAPADGPWTTVMTWNAFKGPLLLDGVEYGSKGTEFERLLDLPTRTSVPLQVALGGADAPADDLVARGWRVVDGPAVTRRPVDYQRYIAGSQGELSVAKQVYVALRTGWFSCRTACYLAAGRPAVVQDTGFSLQVPVGDGLLAFDDADGALAALDTVARAPDRHRRAAREIVAEHLAADVVLPPLLEAVLS